MAFPAKPAAAIVGQLSGVMGAAGMICRGWLKPLLRARHGRVCSPSGGSVGVPPATDQVINLGFVTHEPCDLGPLT